MRLIGWTALAGFGLLAACANTGENYVPVIDGPVGPNFSVDLAQCQGLAARQGALGSSTGQNVAAGAGVAAAGTAVFNNRGTNVRDAAAVGVLAGLAGSAVQQERAKEQLIRNCMRGRGYRVVG